jgi:hypothetical protein
MQRWIRYAANIVCYKCGVPKVVCQRWSADGRVPAGEHTDCQYFGVLIGVVVGIKHGYLSKIPNGTQVLYPIYVVSDETYARLCFLEY